MTNQRDITYLSTDNKTLGERLASYGRVEVGMESDYNFLINPHMNHQVQETLQQDTHEDLDIVV
jgi:hypothetical protein